MDLAKIPGLYFYPVGCICHVGRTTIAGCTAECGEELQRDQLWYSKQPADTRLCESCVNAVSALEFGNRR